MNYIREAENVLKYYRDLNYSIGRMDQRIAKLIRRAGPKDISAMVTDEEKFGNGNYDETMNILFEIQKLSDNRSETVSELKKVECLLEGINKGSGCEYYAEILKKWYVENIPRHEIARGLGYTERHVYRLKSAAIRKFAVRLFGIEALRIV